MANHDGQRVYLTQTASGSHLAATNSAPYFCLEAETEDAVIEKAKAALLFHSNNRYAPSKRVSTTVPVSSFATRRAISAGELMGS